MKNGGGNPYHDKLGRFTTKEGGDISKLETIDDFLDSFGENIDDFLGSFEEKPEITEFVEAKTIEEAQEFANSLLGEGKVTYGKDLEAANKCNKALFDMYKQFGKIIGNDLHYFTNDLVQFNNSKNSILNDRVNKALSRLHSDPEYQNLPDYMKAFYDKKVAEKAKNNTAKVFKENYWVSKAGLVGGITMTDIGHVVINPFSGRETLELLFNNTNHIPPDGYEWVCYHELGHIVTGNLLKKCSKEELRSLKAVYNHAVKDDATTSYGTVSVDEFMSEAIADYYLRGDKARSHHKRVVEIIMGLYNKYYESAE